MKKKNKRIIITSVIFLLTVFITGGLVYWYIHDRNEMTDKEEEIVLSDNQVLVYAKINAISGNEMNYTQVEATEMARDTMKNVDSFDSVARNDDGSMVGYSLTNATNTTLIPVGTEVYTKLGNTTTFSRLANGDIIKMVLEQTSEGEEVVMKVYIVN